MLQKLDGHAHACLVASHCGESDPSSAVSLVLDACGTDKSVRGLASYLTPFLPVACHFAILRPCMTFLRDEAGLPVGGVHA